MQSTSDNGTVLHVDLYAVYWKTLAKQLSGGIDSIIWQFSWLKSLLKFQLQLEMFHLTHTNYIIYMYQSGQSLAAQSCQRVWRVWAQHSYRPGPLRPAGCTSFLQQMKSMLAMITLCAVYRHNTASYIVTTFIFVAHTNNDIQTDISHENYNGAKFHYKKPGQQQHTVKIFLTHICRLVTNL